MDPCPKKLMIQHCFFWHRECLYKASFIKKYKEKSVWANKEKYSITKRPIYWCFALLNNYINYISKMKKITKKTTSTYVWNIDLNILFRSNYEKDFFKNSIFSFFSIECMQILNLFMLQSGPLNRLFWRFEHQINSFFSLSLNRA